MFENKGKVLLVLSQDVLDRARVLAGKATTTLKLPVSLQIVLRALINVGLKRRIILPSLPALRVRPRRLATSGVRRGEQRACGEPRNVRPGSFSFESLSPASNENLIERGSSGTSRPCASDERGRERAPRTRTAARVVLNNVAAVCIVTALVVVFATIFGAVELLWKVLRAARRMG